MIKEQNLIYLRLIFKLNCLVFEKNHPRQNLRNSLYLMLKQIFRLLKNQPLFYSLDRFYCRLSKYDTLHQLYFKYFKSNF